jgi:hypothetical protein
VRIRQIRPEFFSDPIVGRLSPDTRLTYIGLWCIADDAGYLPWDVSHLAAIVYPYESVLVRERRMTKSAEALVDAGRVTVYPCGCALIPRLEDHQKIGGNKSFQYRDRHAVHTRPNKAGLVRPVGSEGSEVGSESRERTNDDEYRAGLKESFRRQGLPVDAA